ncbi:hypothetical protein [Pseudemcibacter aquimaris]|uniref:hypothetical protein n=1 Tax=Pseudemcibacter aquimaris TaxID=2857064 RepID=UPI0020118343|nr:hypothetical protein [Pseudemcibacter aquimaris]MCC3859774.1 hypothetical protein [Pseudemcibacter aquimaris]WDU60168.1 hypothetical protein KW060_07845 [Pseudemcibacter aquimaris]
MPKNFVEGTLSPGETLRVGSGDHTQFFILECDAFYLDVTFVDFNGVANQKYEERIYKGAPLDIKYGNAIIKNPHASSVTYAVYTAPKGVRFQEGRNVLADDQPVTGKALSDYGGNIIMKGACEFKATVTTTADIVAAVDNVYGVIVRHMYMHITSGSSTSVNHFVLGTYKTCIIKTGLREVSENYEEIFVPAGEAIKHQVASGITAYATIMYDILTEPL